MASLVIVVLAIVLTALLVAGGASHFDLGFVSRVLVTNDLRVAKDTIMIAVSNYKMTHRGTLPPVMNFGAEIAKYMPRGIYPPRMPPGAQEFTWGGTMMSDGRMALCLERNTPEHAISPSITDHVIAFARKEAVQARQPMDIVLSDRCGLPGISDPSEMSRSQLSGNTSVAVSFALE